MIPAEFQLNIPGLQSAPDLEALLNSPPTPLVSLDYYWDGRQIDDSLKTNLWLGWTPEALYGLFTCRYNELRLTPMPQSRQKVMGLWDFDVVEIFIAPDPSVSGHYFEVEVSPLEQWLDVELTIEDGKRKSNWEWQSGVVAVCRIEAPSDSSFPRVWQAAIKIPAVNLFGRSLEPGQRFPANFYRCDGQEPQRNYLAWSPTLSASPNFHIPERFGWLNLDVEA